MESLKTAKKVTIFDPISSQAKTVLIRHDSDGMNSRTVRKTLLEYEGNLHIFDQSLIKSIDTSTGGTQSIVPTGINWMPSDEERNAWQQFNFVDHEGEVVHLFFSANYPSKAGMRILRYFPKNNLMRVLSVADNWMNPAEEAYEDMFVCPENGYLESNPTVVDAYFEKESRQLVLSVYENMSGHYLMRLVFEADRGYAYR